MQQHFQTSHLIEGILAAATGVWRPGDLKTKTTSPAKLWHTPDNASD
jgi:hypothetical protein